MSKLSADLRNINTNKYFVAIDEWLPVEAKERELTDKMNHLEDLLQLKYAATA